MGDILLIEDDDDIREVLQETLEYEGFRVHAATNGREGLARIESAGPPSAIVLDLMMPVMNGWEVLDALRADPVLALIPIVITSAGGAHVTPAARSVYLPKPVDIESLIDALRSYCDGGARAVCRSPARAGGRASTSTRVVAGARAEPDRSDRDR